MNIEKRLYENSDLERVFRPVKVTCEISERANRLISESSLASKRTKVQEATLRLEDHLEKYTRIASIGTTSDREEEEKSS